MTHCTLIPTCACFPLPADFDFEGYLEIEQELWALFPETEGKRANFVQVGLCAQIMVEVPESETELGMDETYLLIPCADQTIRPVRMRSVRRLTLSEYRMAHLTAVKLIGKVTAAVQVMRSVGTEMLGEEVLEELRSLNDDTDRS